MAKSVWRQFPDDYLQGWCYDWDSEGSAGQALVADAEALADPLVVEGFFEIPEPPPTPGVPMGLMMMGVG